MYPDDPSSMQPVTFHNLMTDHKLIAALLIFTALVFLVSVIKIVTGLVRIRKIKRMQRGDDAQG